MKRARSRIACALVVVSALLSISPPLRAQQRLDVAAGRESVPHMIRLAQAQPPLAGAPDAQVRSAGSDEGAGDASRQVSSLGHPEHELSPWSMFMSADILVKAVMISLAFASLVTWTIFLAMTFQLSMARRRLGEALGRVAEARTLAEAQVGLGPSRNVLSSLLAAALQEVRLSADSPVEGGIKERVSLRFAEIVRGEAKVSRQGMGILATIGSTAPFVGLFGTVWGIMNSFIGISKSQTTNLAVVAPGIAEALLATAIGLIAAIPAVIIYNHFSRATKGYLDLVRRASGAVARLLSRDIDRTYGRMLSRAAE